MTLPQDYTERVYAGVLGKMIGVYLGRPFEGWSYEQIMRELGEITYYVNDRLGKPLIVTDDDLSGTFTFVRTMPDHGSSPDLTPAQIGNTWLNYIIENRTILWWGGVGNSTEHTAFTRLKNGIPAPQSGSIDLNGAVIAQQIGAQIFIDGWALIAPGDPERAAEFARRAASVSHDGEAVYAAQVIAAMESLAFVESDLNGLIDTAVSLIPRDSIVYRSIADIRGWHAAEPDWRKTREQIAAHYGYDKYTGVCHVIPNHALIIFSLLYGNDDFQKSLMIVNTSGWDTDCNSGNVGCILGIKNGLAGIESSGVDWRSPLADRLYLPTADGGRAITDAVSETYHLVNVGRALHGQAPLAPKDGAQFHFSLLGSVQGFQADGGLTLENAAFADGRLLALHYQPLEVGRAWTPVFIPPDAIHMPGSYALIASPRVYSGQTLYAKLIADTANTANIDTRMYVSVYGAGDQLVRLYSPETTFAAGEARDLDWTIPDTGGDPIAEIGIELCADNHHSGTIYLDRIGWTGTPQITLRRPTHNGTLWERAWVNACDQFTTRWAESFRISSAGRGTLTQGTSDWHNYSAQAAITLVTAHTGGIIARAQGLERYYALVLIDGDKVALIKQHYGTEILAETAFAWSDSAEYTLRLDVEGSHLRGYVEDQRVLEAEDGTFAGGAAGYLVENGTLMSDALVVGTTAM